MYVEKIVEVKGNVNTPEFRWKCIKIAKSMGIEGCIHDIAPHKATISVKGSTHDVCKYLRTVDRLKEVEKYTLEHAHFGGADYGSFYVVND